MDTTTVTDHGYWVRRAEAGDWEVSRAIRLQALAEAPLAFASTLQREIVFTADQWRQRIAGGAQFLGESPEGEVVGTATGVTDPDDPATVLLVAMFVAPAARGTGLADRLVAAVVDQARRGGAEQVRLHVVETNAVAERLYARCGFVHTGATVPLPHRPDLLEHEMVLDLTGDAPARRERPRSEAPGSVWTECEGFSCSPVVVGCGSVAAGVTHGLSGCVPFSRLVRSWLSAPARPG